MRILVTGATGFIGKRMGVELVKSGHEVVALVRNVPKARMELPFPAELHLWDEAGVGIRDIDAVIHLAGESIAAKRWNKKQKAKIIRSRTETTQKLLSILHRAEGRKPSVFLSASAIGFYGSRDEELLQEDKPAGKGFLAETCIAWENETNKARSFISRVVSLRIGIVLDRHGGALAEMLPIFKRCVAGRLGSGKQWMSWIHVEDLVRMFLFCLENEKVDGVVNAVAPNPVTNKEFTQILASALRVPAFFAAPGIALRLFLGEMSALLLGSTRVSAEKILKAGFEFKYSFLVAAFEKIFTGVEKKHGLLCHEFLAEQWFKQPIENIFPFFSDAKNLEEITPPFLHFKVHSQSTPEICSGTLFDYTIRLHGIPVEWRTEILDWKKNEAFTDTQLKGPYELWHHTHSFEPLAGGTLMRDRVVYKLPFGFLGDLFALWKVKGDVEKIFAYRRKVIAGKFPG